MKKGATIILSLLVVIMLFAGCGTSVKGRDIKVYSFKGDDSIISVSNGVIVVGDEKDICEGGQLKVDPKAFSNISAYTVSIYVEVDGNREVLLSGGVVDENGEAVNVSKDLGRISGSFGQEELIDEVADNLWFEIETKNLKNQEKSYKVKLEVKEITEETEK